MSVKFEYTGKLANGSIWDKNSKKRITVEIEDDDLSTDELLDEFVGFMRALGYPVGPNDKLKLVNAPQEFKFDFSKFDSKSDPNLGAVPPTDV